MFKFSVQGEAVNEVKGIAHCVVAIIVELEPSQLTVSRLKELKSDS